MTDDRDWVDSLTELAGKLGFNTIKVRWKLERLRQRFGSIGRQTAERAQHVRYEHKVCPRCRRVNDRDATVCSGCQTKLASRAWQLLDRVGIAAPEGWSVSSALSIAIILVYARMAFYEGGMGLFSFDIETLLYFGGRWPPAVSGGEWWRLGTSIFLHAGIWHIGFNLVALSQIGPTVEEIFGRGRMILFFMLTGVVANVGSIYVGVEGVGIGASGAIMGLCGLCAGWGQRDGTFAGRHARNLMIKWGLYTLVFGFFIGADNAAHTIGFASGFVIGFVTRPDILRRSELVGIRVSQAALGGITAAAMVIWALLGPHTAMADAFTDQAMQYGGHEYQDWRVEMREICQHVEAGDMAEAVRRYHQTQPQRAEVTAENLRQTCASIREQHNKCRRVLAGEDAIEVFYPSIPEEFERVDRQDVERAWRESCRYLMEDVTASPAD